MKEFIQTFKRWNDFGTRSTRREYWSSMLIDFFIIFLFILAIGFQIVFNLKQLIGNLDTFEIANYPFLFSFAIIFLLYEIIRLIPRTALKVRRLHDVGRSGWFILLELIPSFISIILLIFYGINDGIKLFQIIAFFGSIILFIFYCMPSQPGVNKWGSSAKVVGNNNVFSKNKDNSNRFSKGYESLGSMNWGDSNTGSTKTSIDQNTSLENPFDSIKKEGFDKIEPTSINSNFNFSVPPTNVSDNLPLFKKERSDISNNLSKLKIEWQNIPAGTFMMGSESEEYGREQDEILHEVTLTGFSMSKYQITFEQYDIFCQETGRVKPDDEGWGRGRQPVINVSWFDASEFAKWVNCRLPTEAEWEYACRAGTTTPYNTGLNLNVHQANFNIRFSSNILENKNYSNFEQTLNVGLYKPNSLGLCDMHGNVFEWCNDWYNDYFIFHKNDPKGPDSGTFKVLRGGSFYNLDLFCRSANREFRNPDSRDFNIGFRIVKDT